MILSYELLLFICKMWQKAGLSNVQDIELSREATEELHRLGQYKKLDDVFGWFNDAKTGVHRVHLNGWNINITEK
jgi:hypothetical protein